MHICEIILIALLIFIGIRTAYTDISRGVVFNKDLVALLVPGLFIDILYYGIFVRDIFSDFIVNILLMIAVMIFLYGTHSLAGGDLKLGMVMAFLYPGRLYLVYAGNITTLIFAMGIAFVYGYLWLAVDSALHFFKSSENKTGYVGRYVLNFFRMYLIAMVYIMLVSMLVAGYVPINIPRWLTWLLCILVAWSVKTIVIFKHWIVLSIAVVADVILAVAQRVIPFSLSPGAYIFTGFILLCQMFIGTNLYETIKTDDVKAGMILSTASTISMMRSRVKGLPGISSENLSDRLTDVEVESVKRWGKTEKGLPEITVVKKIPFALFIALGYFTYLIVRVALYEI